MNEIPKENYLVPIELSKIRHGWYRQVRDDGLQKLEETFQRASGDGKSIIKGLVNTNPLLIYQVDKSTKSSAAKYECIDGNHRLTLFLK